MEKHVHHPLQRRRKILGKQFRPLPRVLGRDLPVEDMESVDPDDTQDSAGKEQRRLDGHRAAQRIAEDDDLLRLFRLDNGLHVRAELGNPPFFPVESGFAVARKVQGDRPAAGRERLELRVPERPVSQAAVDENERRFAPSGRRIDKGHPVGGQARFSLDLDRHSVPSVCPTGGRGRRDQSYNPEAFLHVVLSPLLEIIAARRPDFHPQENRGHDTSLPYSRRASFSPGSACRAPGDQTGSMGVTSRFREAARAAGVTAAMGVPPFP